MRRIVLFALLVCAGCITVGDAPGDPPGGTLGSGSGGGDGSGVGGGGGGSGSGSDAGGGSGSGSGSGGGGGSGGSVFGPNEPQLVDSDGDGVRDAIDVEPDGDEDYLFKISTCGDPRIDQNHDGHVDAIDIDCNGQIDLLVSANHTVSPAPGANCNVGQPGQGSGHGAAGYGC